MSFSSLNENRLYLKVADSILNLIKQRNIEVGERIPSERVLSTELKVSRPTVREALVALELAGVVDIRTALGVFLKDQHTAAATLVLDKGHGPFEILEARKVLESEACAIAATRISDTQLQQLSSLLQAMEDENLQENPTEKADQAFHCLIARAAGNSALTTMITWLWELRNQSQISTHFHRRVRLDGIRPIIKDHQTILVALQNRDAKAAKVAMSNHLQRVIDCLMTLEEN